MKRGPLRAEHQLIAAKLHLLTPKQDASLSTPSDLSPRLARITCPVVCTTDMVNESHPQDGNNPCHQWSLPQR